MSRRKVLTVFEHHGEDEGVPKYSVGIVKNLVQVHSQPGVASSNAVPARTKANRPVGDRSD
jgi:hypothetical protein